MIWNLEKLGGHSDFALTLRFWVPNVQFQIIFLKKKLFLFNFLKNFKPHFLNFSNLTVLGSCNMNFM